MLVPAEVLGRVSAKLPAKIVTVAPDPFSAVLPPAKVDVVTELAEFEGMAVFAKLCDVEREIVPAADAVVVARLEPELEYVPRVSSATASW